MSQRPQLSIAIVGAQRSGTTTLAWALQQHPDASLGVKKEPHFFDDAEVQHHGLSEERFATHFEEVTPGQALIDATPAYLYLPGCLEALKNDSPQVKVVAILRDPAVHAVSQYAHERRLGTETHRLSKALRLEEQRLSQDFAPLDPGSAHRTFSYVDRGRYERQLRRLYTIFPDALVLRFAQLVDAPDEILALVQRHVGLEPHPSVTIASVAAYRNTSGRTRGAERSEEQIREVLGPETAKAELLLGWTPGSLNDGR